MISTLQRWGNSNAIRIPKKISVLMDLKDNDPIEMMVDNGILTVKKVIGKMPQSLKQLYENFYGKDMEEILKDNLIERSEEILWGDPVGDEEW